MGNHEKELISDRKVLYSCMKMFKILVTFFLVLQVFTTPLLKTCDMSSSSVKESSCCASLAVCQCDDNLPDKIEAVKKQVKTASLDFHFEYKFNSILEKIVNLEENEIINFNVHYSILLDTSRKFRAKLQVFII